MSHFLSGTSYVPKIHGARKLHCLSRSRDLYRVTSSILRRRGFVSVAINMVPRVGLLLRMSDRRFHLLNQRYLGEAERTDGVYQSGVDACATVREAVEMLDGSSDGWSELAGLPAVWLRSRLYAPSTGSGYST